MRYTAFDNYEGKEILLETNDIEKARQACYDRIDDTDGECCVYFLDNLTNELHDINPYND